jgi:hypothetical protein
MDEAPKRYRGPVNGLRNFDSGGTIIVYDAKTMKFKRFEETIPYDQIIKLKLFRKRRV